MFENQGIGESFRAIVKQKVEQKVSYYQKTYDSDLYEPAIVKAITHEVYGELVPRGLEPQKGFKLLRLINFYLKQVRKPKRREVGLTQEEIQEALTETPEELRKEVSETAQRMIPEMIRPRWKEAKSQIMEHIVQVILFSEKIEYVGFDENFEEHFEEELKSISEKVEDVLKRFEGDVKRHAKNQG